MSRRRGGERYEFARGNRTRVASVLQLQSLNMQFHLAQVEAGMLEIRKLDFVTSRKPQARRDSSGNPSPTSFFSSDNPVILGGPLKNGTLEFLWTQSSSLVTRVEFSRTCFNFYKLSYLSN